MTSRKAVLFYLAEDQSARVSMDVCQWILETRVGKAVQGQDSGYRGRAYVPSRKRILFRCISERGVRVDREGLMGLLALPGSFGEMCAEARAIGLARTVERLRDRTEELRATLAANPGAASIHEAIGQLLPVEQPTLTPCDGKRIISKYAQGGELLSPELFPMTHAMVRRLGSDLYEHWLASVLGNVLCGNADNHARPHCLKRHCTASDNGTSGQPVGMFPRDNRPYRSASAQHREILESGVR